ncbi:MAG TPA: response regulator FixJ [Bauldia sp.]|nr:response regulator FixJ [Bauldia sp.]
MPTDSVVHVIDDDDAVRDSLSFLLVSAGLTVRTHESARQFLDTVTDLAETCIVTDVRMPGVSGIDLLRTLRARGDGVPVIVMTGHGDVPLAVEAMKLGAADFLEKPFDDEALLAAVHAARAGSATSTSRDARAAEIRLRVGTLTDRERQVMDGLVEGHPNKVIAFDLGISPRTVEIYRANVMTKMQAGSLSELVRMALLVVPGA